MQYVEAGGARIPKLGRLDVAYVDLLLIHWPHPRVPVEETLDAIATLRTEGAVSHLGVSNFTRSQLGGDSRTG